MIFSMHMLLYPYVYIDDFVFVHVCEASCLQPRLRTWMNAGKLHVRVRPWCDFFFIGIYAYALYVYADGADDAEHVMTIATVTAITILTALSRMSVRGVLERMF